MYSVSVMFNNSKNASNSKLSPFLFSESTLSMYSLFVSSLTEGFCKGVSIVVFRIGG